MARTPSVREFWRWLREDLKPWPKANGLVLPPRLPCGGSNLQVVAGVTWPHFASRRLPVGWTINVQHGRPCPSDEGISGKRAGQQLQPGILTPRYALGRSPSTLAKPSHR